MSQRRGVRVLAISSVGCLVGVTLTGVWQFFAHQSDPRWYGYVAGRDVQLSSPPSDGIAELHGLFGAAIAVIALVGGAWFAYRVLFDVPRAAVISLGVAIVGLMTGSLIRFNLVQLRGLEYADAGRGYLQLFGRDLEFVVTDRWELGPMAIRLWTVAHVATVPILIAVIWLGLPTVDDEVRR